MTVRTTVGVCTYNRAALLRRTLQSLAPSAREGLRLVVLDNASTDETPEVVRAFPQFEYVRNASNLGMVGNWNRALELMEDGFGAVFHDDDEYEVSSIETLSNALESAPTAAFVHCGVRIVDESGRVIADPPLREGGLRPGLEVVREILRSGRNIFVAPTVMFRTSAVRHAGPFDPHFTLTSDFDLWARLALEGDVCYVPRRLVLYRWHSRSGTSGSNAVVNARESLELQRRLFASAAERLSVVERPCLRARMRVTYLRRLAVSVLADGGWVNREGVRDPAALATFERLAPSGGFEERFVAWGARSAVVRRLARSLWWLNRQWRIWRSRRR